MHPPKIVPLICVAQQASSAHQYLGHGSLQGILQQQPY